MVMVVNGTDLCFDSAGNLHNIPDQNQEAARLEPDDVVRAPEGNDMRCATAQSVPSGRRWLLRDSYGYILRLWGGCQGRAGSGFRLWLW